MGTWQDERDDERDRERIVRTHGPCALHTGGLVAEARALTNRLKDILEELERREQGLVTDALDFVRLIEPRLRKTAGKRPERE